MLGVWINVVCLKCGCPKEKKYYIDTIDKFDKFFGIQCSCGNSDCEHFRLIDLDISEGDVL